MRCLIMALVVGVCLMAMAVPAQATKITVNNDTDAAWFFTICSVDNYCCTSNVAAKSSDSCSDFNGNSTQMARVTMLNPSGTFTGVP